MKTITIQDIRDLDPCYDPIKYLPEDWIGTIEELLRYEHIPAKDRLWVAARPKFLSNKILREFALACARSVEHFATDPRVKKCNDINELYLDGKASEQELRIVAIAAQDAAHASAYATTYATTDAAYTASAFAASAAASAYNAAFAAIDTAYAIAAANTAFPDTVYTAAPTAAFANAAYVANATGRNDREEMQCSLLLTIIEMES